MYDIFSLFIIITEELSTSQQQRWQCSVAMDIGSGCGQTVPLFELMCHLLYKYQPHKLVRTSLSNVLRVQETVKEAT